MAVYKSGKPMKCYIGISVAKDGFYKLVMWHYEDGHAKNKRGAIISMDLYTEEYWGTDTYIVAVNLFDLPTDIADKCDGVAKDAAVANDFGNEEAVMAYMEV